MTGPSTDRAFKKQKIISFTREIILPQTQVRTPTHGEKSVLPGFYQVMLDKLTSAFHPFLPLLMSSSHFSPSQPGLLALFPHRCLCNTGRAPGAIQHGRGSQIFCTLSLSEELSKLPMSRLREKKKNLPVSRLHPLWIKSECLCLEPDISILNEELGFESWLRQLLLIFT